MTENRYKKIFEDYLTGKLDTSNFIKKFMNQWRTDRDTNVTNDKRFQRIIDRIFTICDCYSTTPNGQLEISKTQLKDEVRLLVYIWFG